MTDHLRGFLNMPRFHYEFVPGRFTFPMKSFEKRKPIPPKIIEMLDEVWQIKKEWGCIDSFLDHLYTHHEQGYLDGDESDYWDYADRINEVEWLKVRHAYYVLMNPGRMPLES